MDKLTHFSLFTGVAGMDIAAEWADFKTIGQCEWADYPTSVLDKRFPGVPKWRDIRSVTAENFYERTGLRTVDLVSGGFPCQPFSNAGKREGTDDDRYLWPEMLRVVQELKPTWVIAENVDGIASMEQSDYEIIMEDETTICTEAEMVLETVRKDLESAGYQSVPIRIPACAVGTPHRRDRYFIVGHSNRR